MQTTSRILMVRPYRFEFNAETATNNQFQQKDDSQNVSQMAINEFDALVETLRSNDIDVTVVQDTPEPWTPDSIFPNNWFSSHIGGELVLYSMFAENRQAERKQGILHLLRRKMNHTKLIDLTHWENQGEYLEGTGSMIFDRVKNIAYACRSERTSDKVFQDFCAKMGFDGVLFDAVDKDGDPIYHTNVIMEVGTQVAIICLESIKDDDERNRVVARLNETGKIIIDITLEQVNHFAGNMIELKSRSGKPIMVMSESARKALTPDQKRIISTYNKIVSSDLNVIEKNGGGSARCMIAELFY